MVIKCALSGPGGPEYDFEVTAEPPLMYLDHWALRRMSENATLGSRFLAAFRHRGTVMFSLMNVEEIARDASAARAQEIRRFLDQLGPHWVPMTIDAHRIMHAEETGRTPDGHHPCFSQAFLTDPKFALRLMRGDVSLAHVIDLTRGIDGDDLRRSAEAQNQQLLDGLEDWRTAYRQDAGVLDQKFPPVPLEQGPMRSIYHGLARLAITDSFPLTMNHVRDLVHAIAAVRCAQMVTLDAHWATQVGKLRLPPDFVRVYREADLATFLGDLEAAPATRPETDWHDPH